MVTRVLSLGHCTLPQAPHRGKLWQDCSPAQAQLSWDHSTICRALPKTKLLPTPPQGGQPYPGRYFTPGNSAKLRREHTPNHALQGPGRKQSPSLKASLQETNHRFDTVPKTQEVPRKLNMCHMLDYINAD